MLDKKIKRAFKKIFTRKSHDPLTSIFEGDTRIVYINDDFGDHTCVEKFIITDDEAWDDKTIRDWLWDNFAERISSPYDCTGEWFTMRFHLVRIKGTDDIIVLHYLGLDV